VFENQNPDGRDDMKSPADYWGLDKDEESRFRKINKLRSKIAHYGKEIDASSILGHLTNEERRGIITDYGYIIKQSKTFRTAFPEDLNQMRRQFLEVTQIEDFRAVLEALHEQLAEAKRRFDECSRHSNLIQEEINKNKRELGHSPGKSDRVEREVHTTAKKIKRKQG